LVAELNDEIIATCEVAIYSRKRYQHKGEIGNSVKKDYLNNGIGRTLLVENNNLKNLYWKSILITTELFLCIRNLDLMLKVKDYMIENCLMEHIKIVT